MILALQCLSFAGGIITSLFGLALMVNASSSRFFFDRKEAAVGLAAIFVGLALIRASFL